LVELVGGCVDRKRSKCMFRSQYQLKQNYLHDSTDLLLISIAYLELKPSNVILGGTNVSPTAKLSTVAKDLLAGSDRRPGADREIFGDGLLR